MSTGPLRMGSPEWLAEIFSTGPSRQLKGPQRPTQLHMFRTDLASPGVNTLMHVQGRLELHTALALEYLKRSRLVRRAKPQPFATSVDEFGAQIFPDFLVETASLPPEFIVVETKSSRFLTLCKQLELDSHRERFSEFGLRYVVWTDLRPLSSNVGHNLVYMRRGYNQVEPFEDRQQLKEWVANEPNPTFQAAIAHGFDADLVYAAAWESEIYFPLSRPLGPESRLSARPQDDLRAQFLNCDNESDSWWRSLECVTI